MILSAKGIKKSFVNESISTQVLKGIDIDIKEGEFVSIIGKSGSGKSTLLGILSTLDKADEGSIDFEGRDISKINDDEASKLRRESFGFVFQFPRMLKNLNILDNILLASVDYDKHRDVVSSKAMKLMNDIGIGDIAEKRVSQVSGGQLQRAGICRALINNPKILFADEPTGALDSKSGADMMKLFMKLHSEGKSIVLVTHDMNVAAASERVLLMKDGLIHKDLRLSDNTEDNVKKINEVLAVL